MYFQASEPNPGVELELNIIIENKVYSNDEQGIRIARYEDTSYAVRLPKNELSAIKINGEDYWNSETQTFVRVFKGGEYHFKHWYIKSFDILKQKTRNRIKKIKFYGTQEKWKKSDFSTSKV